MCYDPNRLPLPARGVLPFSVTLWVSMVGQQWQLHKAQHMLGRLQDCCAPSRMGKPGIQSRPTLLQASSEEGTQQVASHAEVPNGLHNGSQSHHVTYMHAAWPGVLELVGAQWHMCSRAGADLMLAITGLPGSIISVVFIVACALQSGRWRAVG